MQHDTFAIKIDGGSDQVLTLIPLSIFSQKHKCSDYESTTLIQMLHDHTITM